METIRASSSRVCLLVTVLLFDPLPVAIEIDENGEEKNHPRGNAFMTGIHARRSDWPCIIHAFSLRVAGRIENVFD